MMTITEQILLIVSLLILLNKPLNGNFWDINSEETKKEGQKSIRIKLMICSKFEGSALAFHRVAVVASGLLSIIWIDAMKS